ncbi:MAG: diguanylate cyclase [Lachnospiraceae bacterium]|nr:diguanylate cyclase [Lachnospiraceae bacterium]MBR6469248.1 diguanylate cyclase [Lachnospiraceae bacterium]
MDNGEFITSVVENFIGGICVLDIDSNTRAIKPEFLNEGFYRMIGGGRAIVDKMFSDIRRSIIPDDLPGFDQGISDILADDGAVEFEFRIANYDGSLMWLRLHGNLYSREGAKNVVCAVILDCTEQKMIQEELKRQSDYMHLLMDTDITFDFNCRTDVCVYRIAETDALAHDSVVNGYLEHIPATGIHEEDAGAFEDMIRSAMSHAHRDSLVFRSVGVINPTDEYRWYQANIVSILGKEGYVSHVIGHIVDIHEQKLKEIELRLRADFDGLTGLMNKKATETLIESILHKNRNSKIPGALMILDTDDFKHINDTYGHNTGDRVLSKIGDIIRSNFKGMDVTGRIGGDEFMVFMNNIEERDACKLAEKVGDQVKNAFNGEDFGDEISMSVGIAVSPIHGADFETLYKNADKALYHVKENGKAGYRMYDPKEDDR